MNAIASDDYSHARWSRFPFWTTVQALLTLVVLTTQQAQAAVECEAFQWMPERLDFNAAKDRRRISEVESHHFDARTISHCSFAAMLALLAIDIRRPGL